MWFGAGSGSCCGTPGETAYSAVQGMSNAGVAERMPRQSRQLTVESANQTIVLACMAGTNLATDDDCHPMMHLYAGFAICSLL